MKDEIKKKHGLNVLIKHKGVQEKSMIFCDRIKYMHDRGTFRGENTFDHHLMFYNKGKLVFKVWLKNREKDKEFKDIEKAMESVDIFLI